MQVKALAYGRDHRTKLIELMNQKEAVGDVFNQLRLALQRRTGGRPAQVCFLPMSFNLLWFHESGPPCFVCIQVVWRRLLFLSIVKDIMPEKGLMPTD
jgi:hypothetical protein